MSNSTTKAPARRYVVVIRKAFENTDGRNIVTNAGAFARKGDALAAAQEALNGYRVTFARVDRQVWAEGTDYLTLQPWSGWVDDGSIKEFSRYLLDGERPDESQPAAAETPRTAVVTLAIGGIVYRGEGRTRDEALAAMKPVKE